MVLADFGRRFRHLTIDGLTSLTSLLFGFEFDALLGSFGLSVGGANQLLGIAASSSERVAGQNPVKDPPQHRPADNPKERGQPR